MPFRLGILAYPAFFLVTQLARSSAVAAFEKAGAYDEATSRRAASLHVSRKAIARAMRKRLLVATRDGRYYLDRQAVRRSDRRTMLWLALGLVSFIPLVWLMW